MIRIRTKFPRHLRRAARDHAALFVVTALVTAFVPAAYKDTVLEGISAVTSTVSTAYSNTERRFSGAEYDRARFGHGWADVGGCRDTRAKVLVDHSLNPVRYSNDGCRVVHGRWYGPYSGAHYSKASNPDIDHIVPLAYAWQRGADAWSDEKRISFANDPANLVPVSGPLNRSKGARGPLDWMPPYEAHHCQYVVRFERLLLKYGLQQHRSEARGFAALKKKVC